LQHNIICIEAFMFSMHQ